MFVQTGSCIVLLAAKSGLKESFRFVAAQATAYYLALVLFCCIPATGPYYVVDILAAIPASFFSVAAVDWTQTETVAASGARDATSRGGVVKFMLQTANADPEKYSSAGFGLCGIFGFSRIWLLIAVRFSQLDGILLSSISPLTFRCGPVRSRGVCRIRASISSHRSPSSTTSVRATGRFFVGT